MKNELKDLDKMLIPTISNEHKGGIIIDIESRTSLKKEKKEFLPENIYVERKGQLVKINDVKLIWSSFRKEYKLTPSNYKN